MKMPLMSRMIFSFLGVYLPIGSHMADYSKTHLFNPRWPPHAKFHTGHTLMFSTLLGALTIYLTNRKTSDKKEALISVTTVTGLYWITQFLAILYPNTAFTDPDWDTPKQYILGIPAQPFIDVVALGLTAFAAIHAGRKEARWVE